ncbi:MAG: hypothetical protein R3E89_18500 [Thiolinea sp.]
MASRAATGTPPLLRPLAQGHDVWLNAEMLIGKQLAGTANAGLTSSNTSSS